MYSQLYLTIACLAVALAAGATYALVTDGGRLQSTTAAAIEAARSTIPQPPEREAVETAPKPVLPSIAEHLRAQLAQSLGISPQDVVVVGVERVTWPDGCLGLGSPQELCTQALVEGYNVILSAGFGRYTYRTNLDGSVVRVDP